MQERKCHEHQYYGSNQDKSGNVNLKKHYYAAVNLYPLYGQFFRLVALHLTVQNNNCREC